MPLSTESGKPLTFSMIRANIEACLNDERAWNGDELVELLENTYKALVEDERQLQAERDALRETLIWARDHNQTQAWIDRVNAALRRSES